MLNMQREHLVRKSHIHLNDRHPVPDRLANFSPTVPPLQHLVHPQPLKKTHRSEYISDRQNRVRTPAPSFESPKKYEDDLVKKIDAALKSSSEAISRPSTRLSSYQPYAVLEDSGKQIREPSPAVTTPPVELQSYASSEQGQGHSESFAPVLAVHSETKDIDKVTCETIVPDVPVYDHQPLSPPQQPAPQKSQASSQLEIQNVFSAESIQEKQFASQKLDEGNPIHQMTSTSQITTTSETVEGPSHSRTDLLRPTASIFDNQSAFILESSRLTSVKDLSMSRMPSEMVQASKSTPATESNIQASEPWNQFKKDTKELSTMPMESSSKELSKFDNDLQTRMPSECIQTNDTDSLLEVQSDENYSDKNEQEDKRKSEIDLPNLPDATHSVPDNAESIVKERTPSPEDVLDKLANDLSLQPYLSKLQSMQITENESPEPASGTLSPLEVDRETNSGTGTEAPSESSAGW
jgi:hypothetical protein